MRKLAWVGFLLVPLVSVPVLEAQNQEALNRDAREIFETVLSPYCPGRTIANCPSPQAEELRADIKEQLAAGTPSENIKEDLYAAFGDELRTIPRAQGFGLLAWIVPGLVFLLGAWAIVIWMRRTSTRPIVATEPAPLSIDPEAETRLEAELAELDSMR